MNKTRFLFIVSCFLAAGIFVPLQRVSAQNELGIVWNVPHSNSTALRELHEFRKLGVGYLIINKLIPKQISDTLADSNFRVFVSTPIIFPTSRDITRYAAQYYQVYRDYIHYYNSLSTFSAFGLFENGDITDKRFRDEMNILAEKIHEITQKPIYYIQTANSAIKNDTTFDFCIQIIVPDNNSSNLTLGTFKESRGIYFKTKDSNYFNSQQILYLLTQTRLHKTSPLFFNGNWLTNVLKSHPEMARVLTDYVRGLPVLLSTRPTRHFNVSKSILVIFLLIMWGLMAVHYAFEPNYRKSLVRFFTTHKFFVDDVMEHLSRLSNSNRIVLMGQAFIGGMFFYTMGQAAFSSIGYHALISHYPLLGFIDKNMISLFFLGVVGVLLYNLICIVWIYFGISEVKFPGQAITVYIWSQHMNFILITLMIAILLSTGSTIIIYVLGIMFILVILISFYLSVLDTARYCKKSYFEHLKTTIPHLIIMLTILIWLFSQTQIIDVIRLSANL